MSASPRPQTIAVIGSGIVGMSTALYLQRDGHQVSVLDPRQPGTATSYGNAGAIVSGSITPTSTPGVLRKIPAYLLDSSSAVRVRWGYLPQIAPWLARFILESRPARVEHAAASLAAILRNSYEAHRELITLTGANDIVRPVGWLKVFRSEKAFAESALERRLMDRHSVAYDILSPDEIHQLEPALAREFTRGLFHAGSAFASTPKKLVDGYTAHFLKHGGTLIHEQVQAIRPQDEGGVAISAEHGLRKFDQAVICTGAWSKSLAAQIGDKVVLDTERGYHLTIDPGSAGELRRPVCLPEQSFVLAPMADGIRLTSGEELAGIDAPADFSRIHKVLPLAQAALPGLSSTVNREWMGRRPSTPDSLPVIGRSPKAPQVIYNFAHQHLGLTLGPVTGRITAAILRGDKPEVDVTPYRINRF